MDTSINLYKQRFNLQNTIFSRIDHEDAIVAIVYRVTLPNGTDYILKICRQPSHYFCEIYFLKFFANILPVPRIIDISEPEAGMNGAILMEYIPGSLLQNTSITDSLAYEAGRILAKIHSNKSSGYGDLTQPHNLSTDPALHFKLKFEEGINECSQHLPSALLDKCIRYFNENIKLLTTVDGPCITHRDFRPGNIIVNDENIKGIIDWAGGRGGFAEEDFCPLEFEEWTTSSSIKTSFLSGYASIRSVPDYEKLMPLLRLSRAIATIGFTVKSGTWENKNASLYQQNRRFLAKIYNRNGK